MNNHLPLFEVCLDSLDGVITCQKAGIQRVELCAGLTEGGITPSIGTIQAARDIAQLDIMVMIRPRGGDFLYSPAELDGMARNIEACKAIGVTGVVFGLLTPNGDVDIESTKTLVELAGDLSVTFHRAFDLVRDPFASLDALIELGVDRILTSGQAATAPAGLPMIRQLVEKSTGRIGILPGCGIRPHNVQEILSYTGATEFHATAFETQKSQMQYRNEAVYMGGVGQSEYERRITSIDQIERYLAAIEPYAC